MEAVHEDRRLRVAARHQERGQKVTPTSRTAASSSKAAGRMRRRGTVESMIALHPYAPVPGTQLGWSVTVLRTRARMRMRAQTEIEQLAAVRH